jgi:hypothetical protein
MMIVGYKSLLIQQYYLTSVYTSCCDTYEEGNTGAVNHNSALWFINISWGLYVCENKRKQLAHTLTIDLISFICRSYKYNT